jgi:hypothetical protein
MRNLLSLAAMRVARAFNRYRQSAEELRLKRLVGRLEAQVSSLRLDLETEAQARSEVEGKLAAERDHTEFLGLVIERQRQQVLAEIAVTARQSAEGAVMKGEGK